MLLTEHLHSLPQVHVTYKKHTFKAIVLGEGGIFIITEHHSPNDQRTDISEL